MNYPSMYYYNDFGGLEYLKNRIPAHNGTLVACVLFFLSGAYLLASYSDKYALLSLPELLWNLVVYATPASLVLAFDNVNLPDAADEVEGKGSYSASRTFAAKSQAMRRILGLDGTGALTAMQRTRSLSGLGSIFRSAPSSALAGLGNWDNSCYQNSVLQGLSSLSSLYRFLQQTQLHTDGEILSVTNNALKSLIEDLNSSKNLGQRIWTPPALKNMSSWQQQDAQEYYSKVVDEMEKELGKAVSLQTINTEVGIRSIGLGALKDCSRAASPEKELHGDSGPRSVGAHPAASSTILRNPLEGLLAQRVGCLNCGFVEGLSLIPFNCLTVPLGKQFSYDLQTCLDDYMSLEPISGVECANCTLIHLKEQLKQLLDAKLPAPDNWTEALFKVSGPTRTATQARLEVVERALATADFSESTLAKNCMIPSKNRVSTTKSRQAVVARAPKALVIHLNRSMFDEYSGMLSKNYADVKFPKTLDFSSWCLGGSSENNQAENWTTDPSQSMLPDPLDSAENYGKISTSPLNYDLRAIVTHYGRHENGHYIAYRRTPTHAVSESVGVDGVEGSRWWRLSDEDVSSVSEENVLAQGGVFMLFYERIGDIDHRDSTTAVPSRATLSTPEKETSSQAVSLESRGDEEAVPRDELMINGRSEASDGDDPVTADSTIPIPSESVIIADSHTDSTALNENALEAIAESRTLGRKDQFRHTEEAHATQESLDSSKHREIPGLQPGDVSARTPSAFENEVPSPIPRMRTSSATKLGNEQLGQMGTGTGWVQAA